MTCALELREQKRRLELRKPRPSTLFGLGVALALTEDLPNGDLFALICSALTSVVSVALDLVLQITELVSRFGFYPDSLRPLTAVRPYPTLLYGPSGVGVETEPAFLWRGTLLLGAWALFATLSAAWSRRRALKPLE